MIGQKELISRIESQIKNNTLSRFTIFIGQEGSGKRTLMRYLSNKHWTIVDELPDVKVETIRTMIENAYRVSLPTAYIIPNAQNMSVQAKNALLKVVEEPPQKSVFFMSAVAREELLPTITSRGSIFYMRPYSQAERQEYLDSAGTRLDEQELEIIMKVCSNISEIEKLLKSKPIAFKNYVIDLITHLDSKSAPVVFSYHRMIAFNSDDKSKNKYDLYLLWKQCCIEWKEMLEDTDNNEFKKLYADLISETTQRMSDIRTSSINRSNTFDMWILNCRKILKEWKEM